MANVQKSMNQAYREAVEEISLGQESVGCSLAPGTGVLNLVRTPKAVQEGYRELLEKAEIGYGERYLWGLAPAPLQGAENTKTDKVLGCAADSAANPRLISSNASRWLKAVEAEFVETPRALANALISVSLRRVALVVGSLFTLPERSDQIDRPNPFALPHCR